MNKNGKHRNEKKNHSNVDSYENRVLQRLRNHYSDLVAVKLIEEENSLLRVENGKHTSYIAELEERLALLEGMTSAELALWKFEKKRDQELQKIQKDLEKSQKDVHELQKIYFALLAKTYQNISAVVT